MVSVKNRPAGRISVAAAVVVSVLALAFGTGYSTTTALVAPGGAWLTKGDGVTHANAAAGRPDAEVARSMATGPGQIEVVQTQDGSAWVVNKVTGEVVRIDPAKADAAQTRDGVRPGPSRGPDDAPAPPAKPEDAKSSMLVAGKLAYLVHRDRGEIHLIDPVSLTTKTVHKVPGRIVDTTSDSTGGLWVASDDGNVYRFNGEKQLPTIEKTETAQLSRAGDKIVMVDRAGNLRRYTYGGKPVGEPIAIPGDSQAVLAQTGEDPHITVAVPQTGELVTVTPDGQVRRATITQPGHRLGRPVVSNGRVYVPDLDRRTVLDVPLGATTPARVIPVPGNSPTFELFDNGGTVWANDPNAPNAVVMAPPNLQPRTVEKGIGKGVEDPEPTPEPNTAPPAPNTTTPPPTTPTTLPPAPAPAPAPANPPTPNGQGQGTPSDMPGNGQGRSSTDKNAPSGDSRQRPLPPPAQVTVPAVVGMQVEKACATLRASRIGCVPRPVVTGRGVPNQVTSQSPRSGQQARVGSQVTITYLVVKSSNMPTPTSTTQKQATKPGPTPPNTPGAGRPTPGKPGPSGPTTPPKPPTDAMVEVPNVTKLHKDEACRRLIAAQLKCSEMKQGTPYPANYVHTQGQPAGTKVRNGASVTITYDDRRPLGMYLWQASRGNGMQVFAGGAAEGTFSPRVQRVGDLQVGMHFGQPKPGMVYLHTGQYRQGGVGGWYMGREPLSSGWYNPVGHNAPYGFYVSPTPLEPMGDYQPVKVQRMASSDRLFFKYARNDTETQAAERAGFRREGEPWWVWAAPPSLHTQH